MQSYLEAQRDRLRLSLRQFPLNRQTARGDLMAGLTFAAVNIPQGLAYALMAGITPINGLYTLMVATPVAALFTGSVFMNVSSTSALSASLADTLNAFASEQRLAVMGLLVVLMGVFQVLLGALRLGWIMRFVPNSVMVGFVSGVAMNIILGQIGDLTGYYSGESNKVLKLADTLVNRELVHGQTLTIGLLTIAAILLLERTRLKGFALLAALALASGAALLVFGADLLYVRDVAEIPRAIPRPEALDWGYLPAVLVPALSLGMLAVVQGAAVGQSFPNPDGRYGSLNRDFAGQGLANVVTGFFQGLPAGGSASGTAVLVGAGGGSRWANIFAGLFVLVMTLAFGWLVELVAMPALAGLLIVIGARMINVPAIRTVWHTSVIARTSATITFAATLVVPLQYAVLVGVAVAVLINVFRQAEQVRLVEFVWSDDLFPVEQPAPRVLPGNAITCLTVYGSLFFAAAANVEKSLPDATHTHNAVVLLGLRGQQEVGSTLIAILGRYARRLQANGNRLLLVGVGKEIAAQLDKTGIADLIGRDSIFPADERLGYPLSLAYGEAVRWLAARGVAVRRPANALLAERQTP
jgi:SulP family sulfate permease